MKKTTDSPKWVRFTPPDFLLRDTFGLSAEEVGAHILLWANSLTGDYRGRLPNDDNLLAQIARASPRRWRALKARLARLWRVEKESYVCDLARAQYRESQYRLLSAQSAGRLSAEMRSRRRQVAEPACQSRPTPDQRSLDQDGHTDGTGTRQTDIEQEGITDRTLVASREAPQRPIAAGMRPSDSSPDGVARSVSTPVGSSQAVAAGGFTRLGNIIVEASQVSSVRDSLHLAMKVITGKNDRRAPDDEIVRQVVEATDGANSLEIEQFLLRIANGQKPREVEKYGYFLKIVREHFKKR